MKALKYLSMGILTATGSAACLNMASANIVSGTGWEVTSAEASNATPTEIASLPAGLPTFTFSAPSDPLSFNPADTNPPYTVGSWLATGGATGITFSNGAASGDTMNNTLFLFTGNVTVTSGEMFSVGHDDGVTLIIGGTTVVDAPGPTSLNLTPFTWTGASGTFAFTLAYGECCGPPASLVVDLSLSSVPEPSTWAMLLVGFGGLGYAGFRHARKASVSIA
jgi:PEP-CTERM motif